MKSLFFNKRCFTTLYGGRDVSWAPFRNKEFGNRVLLLNADDPASEELARRAWFELQKHGKQGVYCTVSTKFPVEKTINEGAQMYTRSGCNSMMSIGFDCTTHTAKGIKSLVEKGAKSVTALDMRLSGTGLPVPLISVSKDLTPYSKLDQFFCLHHEEDILVPRFCSPPDWLVLDRSMMEADSNFSWDAVSAGVIAHLYDVVFATHCIDSNASLETTKTLILSRFPSLSKLTQEADLLKAADLSDEEFSTLCNLVTEIASVRSQLSMKSGDKSSQFPPAWVSVIEPATQLVSMHYTKIGTNKPNSKSSRYLMPLTWQSAVVGEILFEHLMPYTDKMASKLSSKDIVLKKAVESLIITAQLIKLTPSQLLDHFNASVLSLDITNSKRQQAASSQSTVLRNTAGDREGSTASTSDDCLSPDGVLQGLIMAEETILEQRQQSQSSAGAAADKSIYAQQTSVNDNKKGGISRLDVLKSDFMLDLVEELLLVDEKRK